MAPWIAHLRLAENLLADVRGVDESAFAVGSVAPDSGVPDEKHEHFTPPSRVTHFRALPSARDPIPDLDFFLGYLGLALASGASAARVSFLLGYFFHRLADNLWLEQIDGPTPERFRAEFAAAPEFIWEVKRDWYGLDLAHVRSEPGCLYWRGFLGAEYDGEGLPILHGAAIRARVQEIKDLYRRTDEEIEPWYGRRPGEYSSLEEYDGFVTGNRRRRNAALEAIGDPAALAGSAGSVLELLA